MARSTTGADELLALEPPTEMDMSAEASGDTATLLRHMDREASTSTPPIASNATMRSLQMPSHFHSQSSECFSLDFIVKLEPRHLLNLL